MIITDEVIPCESPRLGVDWFAPPESKPAVLAKALCIECPVRDSCLVGAIKRDEPWGIWGGAQFPLCRSGHRTARPDYFCVLCNPQHSRRRTRLHHDLGLGL